MAVHKVFMGGLPQPYSFDRRMFPSIDYPAYQRANTDHRKYYSQYANSRHFDFACNVGCAPCGETYAEADQLQSYFNENPVAVGDTIELIGISMENIIEGVWWKIMQEKAGFSFQMQIKGDPASTIPAPINVGPVIDAGIVASGFVEFSPKLYTTSNAMLQLLVTAVPAPASSPCTSCADGVLAGLEAWFSVIGVEPCRGDEMSR